MSVRKQVEILSSVFLVVFFFKAYDDDEAHHLSL